MPIKHKDTKAGGDRGYASEWNKDHKYTNDVLYWNYSQFFFNALYWGWNQLFTPNIKHLKFEIGMLAATSYWPLNETAGVTADDYMDNQDGTFNLAPNWTAGKLGNCAECNGSQRMSSGYLYSNNAEPFTILFWAKTIATGGKFVSNWNGLDTQRGFSLGVAPGGKLYFSCSPSPGSTSTATIQKILNDNLWHHIALTKEANSANMHFWVDGHLYYDFVEDGDLSNAVNTLKYMSNGADGEKQAGKIDNIKYYYGIILTGNQIKFDYANGSGREFDRMEFPTVATDSDETITNAILIANYTLIGAATISFRLSADNGVHWENVEVGEEHEFIYTGTQLKVDIQITGDGEVDEYAVYWNI